MSEYDDDNSAAPARFLVRASVDGTLVGGAGEAWVGYANLSTLFVPFGNSGVQGALQ